MLFGLWISVLFRHAKINHMNDVCCFGVGSANEEVVGFDVSVDEVLFMYCLNTGKLEGLVKTETGIADVPSASQPSPRS